MRREVTLEQEVNSAMRYVTSQIKLNMERNISNT